MGCLKLHTNYTINLNISYVNNYVSLNKTKKNVRRQFELSNHLGNVLAVVSDKKIPRQLGSSGTIGNYEADIISATDYYAFGSPMAGRTFSSPSYRYGYINRLVK